MNVANLLYRLSQEHYWNFLFNHNWPVSSRDSSVGLSAMKNGPFKQSIMRYATEIKGFMSGNCSCINNRSFWYAAKFKNFSIPYNILVYAHPWPRFLIYFNSKFFSSFETLKFSCFVAIQWVLLDVFRQSRLCSFITGFVWTSSLLSLISLNEYSFEFIVGSFQTITVLFIYHWIRLNLFSFGFD